jgi:hypothetical protein
MPLDVSPRGVPARGVGPRGGSYKKRNPKPVCIPQRMGRLWAFAKRVVSLDEFM